MTFSFKSPWLGVAAALCIAIPLGVWAGDRVAGDLPAADGDGPETGSAASAWDAALQAGADAWTWTESSTDQAVNWLQDEETWDGALTAGSDAWRWTADSSATAWNASLDAGADAYDWSIDAGGDALDWSGQVLDDAGEAIDDLF